MFNFNSSAGLIFGNETSNNSSDQILNLLGKNIFIITYLFMMKSMNA